MSNKFAAGAALLSLCLGAATPALAQDYRFAGFEGPRGANATLNLRVPFGARPAPPRLGLTLGFGRPVGGEAVDARPGLRQLRLADLRFSYGDLRRAEVANFDLVHPDRKARLNVEGGSGRSRTLKLVLIGLLGVAVGVGAEMLIDDSDEEEGPDSPDYTPPSVG
jgi:hypothetical protein